MSQKLVCVYDAYTVIIIAALPISGLVYVQVESLLLLFA